MTGELPAFKLSVVSEDVGGLGLRVGFGGSGLGLRV